MFVFSQYEQTKDGKDIYPNTKNIKYDSLSSNLYENVMSCLLYDDRFLDGLYGILSNRLLTDGTFISSLADALSGKIV